MGDSVGCDLCLEPRAGVYNPQAFQTVDYAIKAAHDRGLHLIITLVGDCSNCKASGMGEYLSWNGQQDPKQFFLNPDVITFETLFTTKYLVIAYNADGKPSSPSDER
jgi:mannan endo-1,4-beta-mannosidase